MDEEFQLGHNPLRCHLTDDIISRCMLIFSMAIDRKELVELYKMAVETDNFSVL
jgi:hypothetical protein